MRLLCCICLICTLVFSAVFATAQEKKDDFLEGFTAPTPTFTTPVQPEEVRRAFYEYSPTRIIRALFENDWKNWNMILEKMAAGDAIWIEYAGKYIWPGTDAGATSDIYITMAEALPNNPEAVLTTMLKGDGPSPFVVCTYPFIEPEKDFLIAYTEATRQALDAVHAPHLQKIRRLCREAFEDTYTQFIEPYINRVE